MSLPSFRPDPPRINFKRNRKWLVPIIAVCLLLLAQQTHAQPCSAHSAPVITLTSPTNNLTTQLNTFLLQGTISSETPLIAATLSVSSTSGAKVNSVLGVTIQPSSTFFGTNVVDSLFPGTNIVTVMVQNCFGASQGTANVNYMPVAAGTMVKLLQMEITQATQDVNNSVPLLAGKPTGVRLYFSTGGTAITNVRADISGYQVGGNTPFLAQSLGSITIDSSTDLDAKRRDATKSLNFILTPDFSQQGLTRFRVDRLYVDGVGGTRLACEGCIEWTAQFQPVNPLNLVVVPFTYLFANPDLTADAGNSLMNGLTYLNNVFPLPGNFPTDTAGIKLTILPTRSTDRVLPQLNGAILDDLEHILDELLSQPGSTLPPDTRILGVAPSGSGGVAHWPPGRASYGDIRAIEHTPATTDPEGYGSIWAQEIAHNFGRQHVSTSHSEEPPSDPDFPYAHGGIGEPGYAISTEGWNSTPYVIDPGNPATGAKHAHDFMSYGATKGIADHSISWVSPFTYKALMSLFQTQPALVAPATQVAEDKLVVRGSINAGVATLGPFHLTRTTYAKGSGADGELSTELIDATGQTLLTYRFNPTEVKGSPVLGFSEFVPWKPETKQIVLKRGNTVLATRTVSANKPTLTVTSPRSGETWGAKGAVTWQAADADNDALTYTVLYNNGTDSRWIPVATDVTATSASIDTRLLVGSPNARVRVRATDGVNTTEAESEAFIVPEQGPLVVILRSNAISGREAAQFTGAAYDPRDGMLPATQLRWTSNRDSLIGNGRQIRTSKPLSPGQHIITLTATNSQGKATTKSITVTVK